MRKLPPLTELRAFEAAARHLSFKQAAEELAVTPTAISHQIKLLEQHCGQPLFRRRPRPISLTAAGDALYPVLRDGFSTISDALSTLRMDSNSENLRITATNAFAAKWLVPRLPGWRSVRPDVKLDIVGTDTVLDLRAGQVDIAIRYALRPPRDGSSVLLARDKFHVVASPSLVGAGETALSPEAMARFPLIEAQWPANDPHAPNWRRWRTLAQATHPTTPNLETLISLTFQEELHAIDAAAAGQGLAICSDVLIAAELARGVLQPVSDITLSGYGFFATHLPTHPKLRVIQAFVNWAAGAVDAGA
jgi:LysR family glycine cleavage system transcriptional activator